MADLGQTTVIGTVQGYNLSGGNVTLPMCRFQATQYGVATSMTFRLWSAGGTINCNGAMFTYGFDTTNGLAQAFFSVSGTPTTVGASEVWVTVPISFLISPGSWYWFSCWGDNSFNVRRSSGTGITGQYYDGYVNAYGTYIDDGGTQFSSDVMPIYITYTPRAADNSQFKTVTGLMSVQGLSSIQGFTSVQDCERFVMQQFLNKINNEKINSNDAYRRHDSGLWLPKQKQIYTRARA